MIWLADMWHATYEIENQAAHELMTELGVRRHVRIRFDRWLPFTKNADAIYERPRVPGMHDIVLCPQDSCATLDSLLTHELVHAAQCERMGGTFARFLAEYERQLTDAGCTDLLKLLDYDEWVHRYKSIPWEVEAYRHGERDDLPRLFCPANLVKFGQ